MKKHLALIRCFVFIIVIILADSLFAQPTISINMVGVKWPEVTIQFKVKCANFDRFDIAKQDLSLTENDIEINQYQILCPDSTNVNMDCSIKYVSRCKDGTIRQIRLILLNLSGCPGIPDTAIRSYKAPLDNSDFTPVSLRLGQDTVKGGHTVEIPLIIDTLLNGELFNKATYRILFDDQCSQFQNIITTGYLLDSVSIDASPIPGGYQFQITKSKQLYNAGILALLRFNASDPDQDRECPLKLYNWMFGAGCLRPVLSDGKISIIARKPTLICTLTAPTQLIFDSTSSEYTPNPFPVTIQVENSGDGDGRNGVATISCDKNDVMLVSPLSTKQNINPKLVKDSGGTSMARWDLFAIKRLNSDTTNICIEVSFDNHPTVTCCQNIFIPASPLVSVEQVETKSVSFRQNYPNPFTTTTTIEVRSARDEGRNEVQSAVGNRQFAAANLRSAISLKIFDLLGREVLDLSDQARSNSTVTINNSQLPKAGVYIYRLQNGNEMISRKMIFIE